MITNKYKIYRNHRKSKKLHSLCNSAASMWNHVVMLSRRYFSMFGKSVAYRRMQQQIAKLRKKNPYWKQLNSQTTQEVVNRFYESMDRFFKKIQKRPPKLKPWRKFQSFVFTQYGWKIDGNKFTINKVTVVKFHKSRDYHDIRTIRIKRDSVGDWWLIITSSQGLNNKRYSKTRHGATVGFDFSLPRFLVGSDGTEYNSPLFYYKHQNDIKNKHKKVSSKKKGSKNRRKAVKDLSRAYRQISFRKQNHHWELAHELCKKYDMIAIETLNIEGMKKIWGKKISDLSFSKFVQILKHVATKYGTEIVSIDQWFASSKTCFECGSKNSDLKLSDRVWTCSCGSVNDRDMNAAKNIHRQGIVDYISNHKTGKVLAGCVNNKESYRL